MRHFLIMLSFFIPYMAVAQKQEQGALDSMLMLLTNSKEDTTKANLYYSIALKLKPNDIKKALEYANDGLILSKKIQFKKGEANLLLCKGEIFNESGESNKAITCYEQALKLYVKLKLKIGEANTLNNIGSCYLNTGSYLQAMSYYTKYLVLAEELQDKRKIGLAYLNIGTVFYNQNDFKKSIEYSKLALQRFRIVADKEKIANTLKNMGNAYGEIDSITLAKKYYHESLAIYQELDHKTGEAILYSQIAILFIPDYEKILNYQFKAQKIWDSINPYHTNSLYNLYNIGYTYLEMARGNSSTKNKTLKSYFLKLSAQYMEKAITYTKRNKDINAEWQFLLDYAEVKKMQNNYKSSLEHTSRSYQIKDSLFSQENKNKIAEIESQREIELRDQQIQISKLALTNEKRTRIALISGAALLLLIGGLLFYQSNNRRKTNTTLLKLNSELDEANKVKTKFFGILSHDLRSPIINLVNFLHLQKEAPQLMDEEKKKDFQQKLSSESENLLDNMEAMLLWSKSQMEHFASQKTEVALNDFFNHIQKQFKWYDNITFRFVNDGDITVITDADYLKSIMYNLTANAIKAMGNQAGSFVEWKAAKSDKEVILTITDNGPGVHKEQIEALYNENAVIGTRHGLGLHIIRDLAAAIKCRIRYNDDFKNGSSFTIELA